MKYSLKSEILPLLTIVFAWALGFYFYAHFPDRVVTHWNFAGEPNGYSGKAMGAFLIPGLLTGMYVLFLALPFLDPKRNRYEAFAGVYQIFKTAIIAALFAVFLVTGLNNLGAPVNINTTVPIIVGILFIVLGNFMGKVKQNWFVGVRLPWTLSSENVWNKTNRFGGWSMMAMGIIFLFTPLFPKSIAMFLFLGAVVLMTVGTTVYSYWLYRKEQKTPSV